MNWDAIGAIAELIGAIAVVVTLVLLLIQLRHNAKAIQNASIQSALASNNEIVAPLFTDADLYALYRRAITLDETLTREESGRVDWFLIQIFRMGDLCYQQFRNGGMDDESWEATFRSFQAIYKTPGGRQSWERQKHLFSVSFQNKVTEDGAT